MAAPSLRDAYDCLILGSGTTAEKVAAALAAAGLSTLQLQEQQRSSAGGWLHPRLTRSNDDAASHRLPLAGVMGVDATGRRWARVAAGGAGSAASRLPSAKAKSPSGLPTVLIGASESPAIRARVVIRFVDAGMSEGRAAIGGVYRNVGRDAAEECQAIIFATHRPGEVFWLVPLPGGLTSLGLLTPAGEPARCESVAELFEEALVACPALTQRLLSAELMDDLHSSDSQPATASAIGPCAALSLPEYDGWFDPVFASGDWLAGELATQLVAQLTATDSPVVDQERLVAWQATWSAVEQRARQRIARWYQPAASQRDALEDEADRDWYERLLMADNHSSPAPHRLWEARPLLTPRRAVSL